MGMKSAGTGRALSNTFAGLILCAAAFGSSHSAAQDYPGKAVRVIVPNSAGSVADIVGRAVFAKLSDMLNQQFIIDDRAGAGGNIGSEFVAKAPADGYTLIFATNSIFTINPFLYPNPGFEPLRDFAGVSMVTKVPYVFVVHPSLGVRTMEEFLRLARAKPGQITYSSGGNGHATHISTAMMTWKAGIKLLHVPYKGTGPAMQAVMTGEVGMGGGMGYTLALPHIRSGKVIAIAFGGPRSADVLPGVPDVSKLIAYSEYVPWQAVFAPTGTPTAIINRLNAAVVNAVAASDTKAKMADLGMTAESSSPAELDQLLRSEYSLARELVKETGLKID
jgi:tripartite-type tricarboxylate transporter receptor subunit TctC